MTSTPRRTDGFVHSLVLHDTQEEWERELVTFLEGAASARELPVAIVLPEHRRVAEAALTDVPDVWVQVSDPSITSATSVRRRHELIAECAEAGVERVRLFSEVPHPGTGASADEWGRYEAAANVALAGLRLRACCAYDRTRTPAAYLDLMERCHPWVLSAERGETQNPRYEPATSLWYALPPAPPDPLERVRPVAGLIDPSPAEARRAVSAAVTEVLDPAQHDELLVAVSEVVTNAAAHGRAPVRLRVWTSEARALVAVHDRGAGPQQIGVGLWPLGGHGTADNDAPNGGLGLWLAHQLVHVTHSTGDHGYTVRLTPG